jgi:hypothetical protein
MNTDYNYTIGELKKLYENSEDEIKQYRKLTDDKLLKRPEEGAWSILEICNHLVVFGELYLKEMDKAITNANPMPQRDGPFKPRWHFRKMASLFEPTSKMKMKTLPSLKPPESVETTAVLDDLSDIQANVLYILEQAGASRWDLKKIKGKNPVYRFLSMNLIEYLVMIDVHQRRHFWQIEQVFNRIDNN